MFGISFLALTKFGEKDFRRAGMDPSKYKVKLRSQECQFTL